MRSPRDLLKPQAVGAWSLHPKQIDIAKRVFSPDPTAVRFARRALYAMPDGRGVLMRDGSRGKVGAE